jgi:hypothetical protein
MLDETVTSDSGGSSPATDTAGSSPAVNAVALGGESTGSDASASTAAQSSESTSGQETTAQASEDPFAKYQVGDDANIQQIREAHKLLLNDHREIQKSTQAFDPWKPVIEQYHAPEQIQPLLEIANGLFTPKLENGAQVYENGIPVTTAIPAIQMLHDQSPATFMTVAEEIANFELNGKPIIDWQLMAMGLDPANIAKYVEWEKNGGPVANVGDAVNEEDLARIPPELRDIFKAQSLEDRTEMLLMSDITRKNWLEDKKFQSEVRASQMQQEEQREQQRQAYARQQQEVLVKEQNTAVDQVRNSTFEALYKEVVAGDWKPSADESINAGNYALVMGAMCVAADPVWRSTLMPLFEKAGLKIDTEGFDSLMNQVEQGARNHKAFELSGDHINARNAKGALDSAVFQLKTKANGLRAELVALLSGTRAEIRQAQESRINAAGARPVINGRATSGNGGFQLPPGVKPFSPEATQAAIAYAQGSARQSP